MKVFWTLLNMFSIWGEGLNWLQQLLDFRKAEE